MLSENLAEAVLLYPGIIVTGLESDDGICVEVDQLDWRKIGAVRYLPALSTAH